MAKVLAVASGKGTEVVVVLGTEEQRDNQRGGSNVDRHGEVCRQK